MPLRRRRDERGVVLLVVLFFALLLSVSVATFVHDTTVDAMIAKNREQAAQADSLARSAIRLAELLLLEDRLQEQQGGLPLDTHQDTWAQVNDLSIPLREGVVTLSIEDTGGKLNLNALFQVDETGEFAPRDPTEEFLVVALERVIEGMPLPPGERALYDPRELAHNLMDWVDSDEERQRGGPEDDYYQRQDPPYRAANRPLFSVDELRQVEGYDAPLVDALDDYVSVYPYAPGGCGEASTGCGINVNTAPPWVLYLLYSDDGGGELRLADEDLVRSILRIREEGAALCPEGQSDPRCRPMNEVMTNAASAFPPPTFTSEVFVVEAEARVVDVRRRVQAVLDRSALPEVRLLSWRAR